MSFPFRAEALERDGHACVNCGAAATEVHHIVPRSRGGRDVLGNLASLCEVCHGAVHQQDMVKARKAARGGRSMAKKEGIRFGRPRSWTDEQAAAFTELKAQGYSQRRAAKELGMSETTLRRMIAEMMEAAKP